MNCPKCGSEVYDNRAKKQTGAFKANAPDFKCQNKNCDWVQWPPRGQKDTPPAPIVPPSAPQAQSGAFQTQRDAVILELFWDSFDNVLAGVAQRKLTELFKPENLCSLVATQFIQRAKG